MQGKIYLVLLIFCEIWFQGIIGTFADENIGESSSLLVREKRVVSHVPGEDISQKIEDYPYIVHIKQFFRISCVGAILTPRVIISAAECGQFYAPVNYNVISKSSRTSRGLSHNVTEIRVHFANQANRHSDGIALFFINPSIVYSRYSFNIDLYVGHITPGMEGVISGWGYDLHNPAAHGTNYTKELRSIKVPIMSNQDCANVYQNHYIITDKDICTFHPHRHSGHNDYGAPLVVGNALAGIFLRRGPRTNLWNVQYPDVFAFLPNAYYSTWIRANI